MYNQRKEVNAFEESHCLNFKRHKYSISYYILTFQNAYITFIFISICIILKRGEINGLFKTLSNLHNFILFLFKKSENNRTLFLCFNTKLFKFYTKLSKIITQGIILYYNCISVEVSFYNYVQSGSPVLYFLKTKHVSVQIVNILLTHRLNVLYNVKRTFACTKEK